jgi:hypothetical protein
MATKPYTGPYWSSSLTKRGGWVISWRDGNIVRVAEVPGRLSADDVAAAQRAAARLWRERSAA